MIGPDAGDDVAGNMTCVTTCDACYDVAKTMTCVVTQLVQPYLDGRRPGRDGGEANYVAEVDGDAVVRLGFHSHSSLESVSHGPTTSNMTLQHTT